MKTPVKHHPLSGRKAVIDFHSWDFTRLFGETRKAKLASLEGNTGWMRRLTPYDGQTAEIIERDPEGGWVLLMADGKILTAHDMAFSVLPQPIQAGWEYRRTVNSQLSALDAAGKEGWELVAIEHDSANGYYLFKRPLTQ